MAKKMQSLIRSFLNEGLLDKNSMPLDMAKLNPQSQQNLSTTPPPAVDPTEAPTNAPAVSPEVQNQQPEKKPEDQAKEDLDNAKSSLEENDALDEIQAAHSGVLIAEYHVGKLCSSLTEGEDIDLEKLRGTKEMLTDARKAMYEYWNKKRTQSKPEEKVEESINEDRDLIGASVFGIGGEEKLVNLNKGRDPKSFIITSEEDLNLVKKVRNKDPQAPVFFQIGGNYYRAKIKKMPESQNGNIEIYGDGLTKKQALDILASYVSK